MTLANLHWLIQKQRDEIDLLENRVKALEILFKNAIQGKVKVATITVDLPDHLRKTYNTLTSLKEATANQVATVTNRARAVESCYLNQLVALHILSKRRVGIEVWFAIDDDKPSEPRNSCR